MSGHDDEQDRYPAGGSHSRRDGKPNDPLNPSLDTTAFEVDTPVDLAAVQADDALLSMLGRGVGSIPAGSTDAELARVLTAWRREVDAEPFGDLVAPDTAPTMITAARRSATTRRH